MLKVLALGAAQTHPKVDMKLEPAALVTLVTAAAMVTDMVTDMVAIVLASLVAASCPILSMKTTASIRCITDHLW